MRPPVPVPPHEVEGAVDRIEDPPARTVTVDARLLAQHGVVGTGDPQRVDQHTVDREIHVGHRRAVGLRLGPDAGRHLRPGGVVGEGGELQREREVGGEVAVVAAIIAITGT